MPELLEALKNGTNAVLVAPPGAGKTTRVPLALIDEPWAAGGKIILLEPRRLAARAAAARMSASLGDRVGGRVGYRVRLDSKVSSATRIEVVTEGVFTRMIIDDPGLEGVAALIFDEFHERSLDADLGLAFARDAQALLREDLRLLVMSATLDAAPVARLLDDAPVIVSEGRAYPVETRYLGKAERLDEHVTRAILSALARESGSLLVFLPGQGEILRQVERLGEAGLPPEVDVFPLYGALDAAAQDHAIAPAPPRRRKIVLATDIAQTSLTIEGVRVVIDAGLARVPRYEVGSGLTRLVTVRASRASVDQRRGRAGRTEPGVCVRLWDEAENRGLPPFDTPEIKECDLSRLALDLARWGGSTELAFLDPPPAAGLQRAREILRGLQALDDEGCVTDEGRALAELPLPPRLAHMVLAGRRAGRGGRAGLIAALVSERGLGGADVDLDHRMARFLSDRSPRAAAARAQAERWGGREDRKGAAPDGVLVGRAWPERLAKARGEPGEFLMANGRGAFVEPTTVLAREEWLAIADLAPSGARDRILLAAPLTEAAVRAAFGDAIKTDMLVEWSPSGAALIVETERLGAITLSRRLKEHPDLEVIVESLCAEVRREGFPWGEQTAALLARARFAGVKALAEASLPEGADVWLGPLLRPKPRRLTDLPDAAVRQALLDALSWTDRAELDRLAPPRWTAPTGSSLAIDYAAEAGPSVEVRVQECFGLSVHPTIGAGVPLTLVLLSPAHRPIQVTRDLPGFWRGSWADVRKDLRGRYPKHPWPEDPTSADPTRRAKPKGT